MPAESDELRTDVDTFLELIRQKKKISLADAAKALNMPLKTIQAWTDFLVEEKIVGTEYKFTTPYVFIEEEKKKGQELGYIGFDTKEAFFEKAKSKGIREGHIKLLWVKYLNANKEGIKKQFYEKAKEKGLGINQIDSLWQKYEAYLESD